MNRYSGNRAGIGSILVVLLAAGFVSKPLPAADAKSESPAKAAADSNNAAPDAPAPLGSLIGVTLAPGGFSLAAVNVVIRDSSGAEVRELITDTEGAFMVKDLPPGTYGITAQKDNFSTPAAAQVIVAGNRTANANVQLTQGVSGSLRGVTLAPDGFAMGAVTIEVHSVRALSIATCSAMPTELLS